jgi:hypothetical protein
MVTTMSPVVQEPEDIAAISAIDEDVYADLDLNRLLVFSIGWLRDRDLPLTFEYITVVGFRFFPLKFSLRGFPYPDSNRVNRGLLQLGPKYRNWARGKASTGWALTRDGEVILTETSNAILGGLPLKSRSSRSSVRSGSYTLDPAAELAAVLDTAAFRTYSDRGPEALRIDDVWEVVGAFSYTPPRAISQRLQVLARLARDSEDNTAGSFLSALTTIATRHSGGKE